MLQLFRSVADAKWFQRLILGAIIAAGVLVGLETYPAVVQKFGRILHALDQIILGIFIFELVVKIGARGRDFLSFFKDPWNVFDFLIVVVCLLPFNAQFAAVLRLVRVLRVLRLVTALPRLQILVGALIKSIPSMGYVALLLLLLFYIYAVIGTSLFARNDPLNFGTLNASMLSLFQVVTLEGWAEIFRIQYFGSANFGYEGKEHLIVQSAAMPTAAVLYFVTFILIGTMVMLNLLIGVIMNGMQEAQQESDRADREKHEKKFGQTTSLDELELLEQKLTEVHHQISVVRSRLCKTARQPGKPSEIARQ